MIISGTFQKMLWRNERTGDTVFLIDSKELYPFRDRESLIKCRGVLPDCKVGALLSLTGTVNTKAQVFEVTDIRDGSEDIACVQSYLISVLDGFGKKTVEKVMKITGIDVFRFIKKETAVQELVHSGTLKEEKARFFVESLKQYTNDYETIRFITRYEGTADVAIEIANKYGASSVEKLQQNPYQFIQDCGLSFKSADLIAQQFGVNPKENKRIEALILEAVEMSRRKGNSYTVISELTKNVAILVKRSAEAMQFPVYAIDLMRMMEQMQEIVLEDQDPVKIWLVKDYMDEKVIVRELERLSQKQPLEFDETLIDQMEDKFGIQYQENQRKSFDAVRTTGVKCIIGGPGTGKTTTVNGLIHFYKINNPGASVVRLCAPTGRAAQRMKEATDEEALTMHKLASITMQENMPPFKTIEADCIVVDEMSMTSASLFATFLQAVKSNTLVLLVGDEFQLPSVEPGNVLHDLIASGLFEVYRLEANFRQVGQPTIVENAYKINHGDVHLKTDDSFEILNVDSEQEAAKKAVQYYLAYNKEAQILTPIHRGESGTVLLNNKVKVKVNPADQYDTTVVYGNTEYSENDMVISLKNNYDTEPFLYNGDIGHIDSITPSKVHIQCNHQLIALDRKLINQLALAYAITIHKSQGSEFPVTIIVLPDCKAMLIRKLLYTAVTRAKRKVIIISVRDSLKYAIRNENGLSRRSWLMERLNGTKSVIHRKNYR